MEVVPSGVRNLFRAALIIFVITVVIGILNGTDVWDPPHSTLLTHVHAGTLGWITLSVFAATIWMFGDSSDPSSGRLATFSIVAMSLYVFAFWSGDIFNTTESIQRPIGGTLAFIAIVWMTVWVFRQKKGESYNVAEFGMALAILFLLLGAILGVLLGLQLADVQVVSGEAGTRLGDAHPAAMVIGYVVLAMLAILEWRFRGSDGPTLGEAKPGVVQMVLMFLAGLFGMLGLLLDIQGLLMISTPFQVIGLVIFLWRMRKDLAPSQWAGDMSGVFLRTAALGLVVAVVFTAIVVNKFIALGDDTSDEAFEAILPYLLALDHTTFILVVTNVIFGLLAVSSVVSEASNKIIYYGVNIGAVGFIVGLVGENSTLKRIFTPILGLTILYGIYMHLVTKPAMSTKESAAAT
ncbi:MAG TPA: hypothetical protein VIW94_01510 [Acidimicrobiia bacterium]